MPAGSAADTTAPGCDERSVKRIQPERLGKAVRPRPAARTWALLASGGLAPPTPSTKKQRHIAGTGKQNKEEKDHP